MPNDRHSVLDLYSLYRRISMANPVFDPERALGLKLTKMDRQELCEFVSAL